MSMNFSKAMRRAGWAIAVTSALSLAACDSPEERAEDHYNRGLELLESAGPTQAVLEFRNAIRMNEEHAGARYQLGSIALDNGDAAAAMRELSVAVEQDPANADAQRRLGEASLLVGDAKRAAAAFDAALSAEPEDSRALSGGAAAALRLGDTETAIARARKALELDPEAVDPVIVLAMERFDADARDEAFAVLDDALAERPDERALNVAKLLLLNRAEDQAGVERQLTEMIKQFPDESALVLQRARLRIEMGKLEGAEADLRQLADAPDAAAALSLSLAEVVERQRGAAAAREEIRRRIDASEDREFADPLRMALVRADLRQGDNDAAEETLRRLLSEETPTDIRHSARVVLGGLLLAEGDTKAASEHAASVLAEDAGHVNALALRAEIAIQDNRAQDAISDLRLASAAAPDNPRLMMLEARAHERNGDLGLSTQRMAAATRAADYAPEYALRYAKLLRLRGDSKGAREALEEAAQRHDDSVELWRGVTEARMRAGDTEAAGRAAQKLRELGDERGAEQAAAALFAAEGDAARSIAALENLAEKADDGDAATLTALVVAYVRSGDVDRATAKVEEEMAARPEDPMPKLLRAELYFLEGDTASAAEQARAAIDVAPEQPFSYLALTRLKLSQGDPAGAEEIARTGVEKTDASSIRLMLAQMLERKGDFDGAIELYRRLSEENPESLIYANNLASLVTDHQEIGEEELELLGRLATRLRGYDAPELQDTYAWIRFLQGALDDAREAIDKAVAANSSNPIIRYHAGRIHAATGDAETARAHLEAALEAGDAFPFAEEARATLLDLDKAASQPEADR